MSRSDNPTKAVLFDMDGVLIDSYEAWFQLLNTAAAELGYSTISRARFHETWGQGVQEDAESFFPQHTAQDIARYYDAHFVDHVEHVTLDPAAVQVLEALRERSVGTAVVTNTPTATARRILEARDLRPDTLVGETDVASPKPAPDMLHEALRRLELEPGDVTMVGDSRYDRDAARAAGVRFAGLGGIEGDLTLRKLSEVLQWPGLS